MKIAVYAHLPEDVSPHSYAFVRGLKRHGIDASVFSPGQEAPANCDIVAAWGWRNCSRYRHRKVDGGIIQRPVIVLERGFIDRMKWTSIAWNGLNGRGEWNEAADNGERFDKNFGHMVGDWYRGDGYALIMGQVKGDAALAGVDIDEWYVQARNALFARGFEEVRIREHPVAIQQRRRLLSLQEIAIEGSLDEALSGASVVVTYNSNSGVDAALAGIPVIACDEGSMAWPVAAHGLEAEIITPDRRQWCTDLSWRQWTLDEMSSGFAWDHVRRVL